jgi:hypothetical protein
MGELAELKKIRLGSVETILKPRGSMEKESIGLTIFERLEAAIDWWTRRDYEETPSLFEVLATAKKNLDLEVEGAWNKILSQFEKEAKTDLVTFLTLIIIKKRCILQKVYDRITKSYDEFLIWINFCDNLRQNERLNKHFMYVTEIHLDFSVRNPKGYPKYIELYNEVVEKKGGKKE